GAGGGGLWKTVNGGLTWSALFTREGSYSVGDLALDPTNSEVVWLGSGEANMRNSVSFGNGVYKSVDGGKTWKHLGLANTLHIARVLVNPLATDTAWVCAVGRQAGPSEDRGVFMTTDGGATWRKTLYLDNQHGCSDLDVDPKNPNVLYAALWKFERKPWTHTSGSEQGGIWKSIDGGRTWTKSSKGLPKLLGRLGVKVAPSRPSVVYITAESFEGTLYRSDDAAENWRETTRNREVVSRGFYYSDLRVDPTDENRVYAVASNLLVSIDAGKTWRNIVGGTHIDYHSLWIDPTNPSRMWQGQDGGIAVTYDRGNTWEPVTNIPLGQFYQIHADQRLPFYHVTGGLQDNGTWSGPSRTREPAGILNDDFTMVSFGDGFHVVSHPDNPDLFVSESQGGSIMLTNMRTREQQMVSPQPKNDWVQNLKYRFNWNTPIVPSPHGKTTLYFGSNFLFQSRDFGKSWEPISPDLTTNNPEKLKPAGGPVWLDNSTAENNNTIISVGESPAAAGVIWVGTDDGNLQLSADGGKTWNNLAKNVPGVPAFAPVSHVEPSRTGRDTAYVSFDAHLLDDYRPLIFKTTDAGKNWTRLTAGLPDTAYVHIVREDPKNARLLYAGTELGLYASWNGGEQWQP
ncbi:MAG TPA: glycosyl hydrolase, partial [Solibacterales bacterium]|nr:glycosyl hydrolase [Bryobacterales bacterium]